MKKVLGNTLKLFLAALFVFCMFNIISSYAAGPIFKITGFEVSDKSAGVTINNVDLNNDEITNDIVFSDVTDYITYDVKLSNVSDDKYTIKSITDNNSSEYLKYTYDDLSNTVMNSGDVKDFKLTVTYIKQATDPNLSVGKTNLVITYEKENGESGEQEVTPSINPNNDEEIKINPQTNDNVAIYFIIGGISLALLILLAIKKKKNTKLLIIPLLVLIPLCVKASTLKLTVVFNNTIKAVSYDVEINLGNGSSIIYNTLAKGAKLERPETPQKRGYTFDNWYSNNEVYNFDNPVSGNVSLEARYTLDTYNITYDLAGGTLADGEENPTQYNVNSVITLYNPTKVGHVFNGWRLNGSSEVIPSVTISNEVGIKSYTAVFTPEKYTITFNPNNGESSFTVDADYGTKLTAPTDPSLAGYTFNYWKLGDSQYNFNSEVTGPFTLVAQYTANGNTPYKVYHKYRHLNDDEFDVEVENLKGKTGNEVELSFKPKTGFDNPNSTKTLVISGTGDASEEYIYERTMYSLNVPDRSDLDSSSTSNGSYPFETAVTLKANNKEGHDFTGWQIDGQDGYVSTDSTYSFDIDSNIIVTPVYTPKTYDVTINPNNGDDVDVQQVTYGNNVTRPENNPTKEAYDFDNWYVGNNVYDFATSVSNSFEIIAKYTPKSYTIHYVLNGGSVNGTNPTSYTIEDEFTLVNPTKEGYTFIGWSTDSSDDLVTDVNVSNQYGEITYIANFTPNTNTPYTIVHKYKNLAGSQEEYTVVSVPGTGTTDTTIPAPIRHQDGFVDPTEGTVTILGNGEGTKEYIYNREEYTLNVTDRTNLDSESTSNGNYEFETLITLTARDVEGYVFNGWKLGSSETYISTDKTYSFNISGNVSITPVYTINTYDVSFNPNNGVDPINYATVNHGSLVTKPTDPVKDYYTFDYWTLNNVEYDFTTPVTSAIDLVATYHATEYTITYDLDGGSLEEGQINPTSYTIESNITLYNPTKEGYTFTGWTKDDDETLIPSVNIQNQHGNVTYTAHYTKDEEPGPICKKATTIHTETCNAANNTGCRGNNKYAAGDTIYYGNVIQSDTLQPGDALDCNVDGTGYNQRFYYVTNNSDNAVLISNTNFNGEDEQNNIDIYFNYSTSLNNLPTTTQWSNLPVKFEVQSGDFRPARFIKLEELQSLVGDDDITENGSLDDFEFLFENSKYSGVGQRSTVWVQETSDGKRYRYRNDNRNVVAVDAGKENTSNNCNRPVIEVPLDQIEDSYIVKFDANGGVNNSFEYLSVAKGSKLNTLPTVTYNEYSFGGWYDSLTFTNEVNENTIPDGYNTYFAKWTIPVSDAILTSDDISVQVDESQVISIENASLLEPITFTSNDESIATVDQSGRVVGVSDGTTTIVITGNLSHTTKEVTVTVVPYEDYYSVTLDYQDGRDNGELLVNKVSSVTGLPNPTRTDYTFKGWFKSTNWLEQVVDGDVIDDDITLYARWMPNNAVTEMNKEYYTDLTAAFTQAPDNVKTTIVLLKDVTGTDAIIDISGDSYKNKNIVFDLDGHTISLTNTGSVNLIKTVATIEVKNGTLTSKADSGVVEIDTNGKFIMNSGTIQSTNSRKQAIYNNGGTVEIGGTARFVSKANGTYNGLERATVTNVKGTTSITGGTIINTSGSAVSLGSGTLTIGEKDGTVITDAPVIIGKTYGVVSATNDFSFYDGVIKGVTDYIKDRTKLPDTNIEAGYEKNESQEVIDTLNYKVLTLVAKAIEGEFTITLHPNGGELSTTSITVNNGDTIDELPTPVKGVYKFDGWFYDSELTNPVDLSVAPTSNDDYYAKWSNPESGVLTTFRTTNDAMKEYYSKIDVWKDDSSNFPTWGQDQTTSPTAMRTNFDSNNCMCADGQCSTSGTVHCDKPNGYDTKLGEQVNVYLYDNNTKGDLVTYSKSSNGVIYNLIPDKVYYWEKASDTSVNGLIKFVSERRVLDAGDVLNVRDLGGLPVDVDGNGSVDGHLAYGRLFRGIKLNSASSVTELNNLGITHELDLRAASDEDVNKLSNYNRIQIQNYYVMPNSADANENTYYGWTRSAVKYVMEQVAYNDDVNIYFHCRIGTDRTGTLAYILEGLLGVPEEDRIQDYELSFFYGLVNIHRYHDVKPTSSAELKNHRFVYFHDAIPTNDKIKEWYMAGSENTAEDEQLIQDFRNAMIE